LGVHRRTIARSFVLFYWILLALTTASAIGIPLPLSVWFYRTEFLVEMMSYSWAAGAVALAVALFLLALPPRRARTPLDVEDVLVRRHDRLRFTSWLLLRMGQAGVALAVVNLFWVPLPIPNWAVWLLGFGLFFLGTVFGNRALDLMLPVGRLRHLRKRLGRAERRRDPDEIAVIRAVLASMGMPGHEV
jgi:hypothetical protein